MTNLVDAPAYRVVAGEMEARLGRWIAETFDPFEFGVRLPDTDTVDLGQRFTSCDWYAEAPAGYADAITRYAFDA